MKKIYIIRNTENGECKIGISKNPKRRVKSLQTANSARLELVYVYETKFASKIEKVLHRQFHDYRSEGEWFNLNTLCLLYKLVTSMKETDQNLNIIVSTSTLKNPLM